MLKLPSVTEHHKNKITHSGLQEVKCRPHPTPHQHGLCGKGRYSGCTAADKTALQRIIITAQKITGCSLPSLENIACSHYLSRAKNIIKDTSHPGHHLFTLLPCDRRYMSSRARTTCLKDSFFPTAIRTIISHFILLQVIYFISV